MAEEIYTPINVDKFEIKHHLRRTDSQNLASAALSTTTTFNRKWQLLSIFIHFSAVCSQTLTVTFDSKDGANYDTVLSTQVLVAATDVYIQGESTDIFWKGDELTISITTGGAAIAYVTINGKKIS